MEDVLGPVDPVLAVYAEEALCRANPQHRIKEFCLTEDPPAWMEGPFEAFLDEGEVDPDCVELGELVVV